MRTLREQHSWVWNLLCAVSLARPALPRPVEKHLEAPKMGATFMQPGPIGRRAAVQLFHLAQAEKHGWAALLVEACGGENMAIRTFADRAEMPGWQEDVERLSHAVLAWTGGPTPQPDDWGAVPAYPKYATETLAWAWARGVLTVEVGSGPLKEKWGAKLTIERGGVPQLEILGVWPGVTTGADLKPGFAGGKVTGPFQAYRAWERMWGCCAALGLKINNDRPAGAPAVVRAPTRRLPATPARTASLA